MAYDISVKEKAIALRKQGLSLSEISKELKIAKSTSSLWLESILLDKKAQNILQEKKILGQYKSRIVHKEKKLLQDKIRNDRITANLATLKTSPELSQLCCSLLYWCEGNKGKDTQVRFTNSDPKLIKTFLYLLRSGFEIEESKFRILMHLHSYHNEDRQKQFWSRITKIPINQFYRTEFGAKLLLG